MLTPYGQPADHMEKVMLLAMWANHVGERKSHPGSTNKPFIFAGLGKPTYPINAHTVKAYQAYWEKMKSMAERWHLDPENGEDHCAIGYGSPYGEHTAKTIMAEAMSKWYESEVEAENVLFTVGGIGGLRVIFDVLNSFYAKEGKYRVITPFPHYSAYANNPSHLLHPIEVMTQNGYQVTAKALEESIQKAYSLAENDDMPPKAILLCNPSNPLGTIIESDELQKIAMVMRQHPELHIIFDEAYAEMNFIEMPSFLKIAPDLKQRTVILRSATKALSAAGERMAVVMAFDDFFISELVNQKIASYIHAPLSAQIAYAQTMLHFSKEDRQKMSAHYKTKVEYVMHRIQNMGADMPCAHHQVEATFYALGDFTDMIGLEMPDEARQAIQKQGKLETGEDLAYYLLFKERLMVAPLSYFGLSDGCGYLRITCSAKQPQLKEMMDRLEHCLTQGRLLKKHSLIQQINTLIDTPDFETDEGIGALPSQVEKIQTKSATCRELKQQIQALESLLRVASESHNKSKIKEIYKAS